MRLLEGNFHLDKVDGHYVLQAQCQTFIGHNVSEVFMNAAKFSADIESNLESQEGRLRLSGMTEAEKPIDSSSKFRRNLPY